MVLITVAITMKPGITTLVHDMPSPEAGLPLGECWQDSGIYYVEVMHPAMDSPTRVVLHGVSTDQQAWEACRVLRRFTS